MGRRISYTLPCLSIQYASNGLAKRRLEVCYTLRQMIDRRESDLWNL